MTLTLRKKLIVLYFLTVMAPLVIILFFLPHYYNGLFTKQTTLLTEGTLTSLTRNVEMYLNDLDRLTLTPYLNDDVMEGLKLKASNRYEQASQYSKYMAEKAFRQTLPKQLRNTREDILGTILLPADGSVYMINAVDRSSVVPDFPFREQDWYRKAVELDGRIAYISSHPQNYIEADTAKQVFSVARLLKDPDSGKPLGVIMTDAANILLEKIVSEIKFNVTSIVAVLDENKRPLYANRTLTDDMLRQLADNSSTVVGEKDTYRVIVRMIPNSGWSIAVLFSNREFQSQLRVIYRIGELLAAAGLLITLLLNISLTYWVVNPFREMVKIMKKVQRGELNHRFQIRGKDEVAQLGLTLNNMIVQLKELIDREYRAVLDQRNAEYRALQSQIQPHFLYNTLSGFVGLSRAGQNRLLEKAILSLSGMLRYTLEHRDLTTFREEFAFLREYTELQRMRFQERLTVSLVLDPELKEAVLPKLLLQPLVENAIIHGIEPLDRPGTVTIRANIRDEPGTPAHPAAPDIPALRKVVICIEDNGPGFEPRLHGLAGSGERRQRGAADGVGLSNVRERLLLFSQGAEFSIVRPEEGGTRAEITLPAKDVNLP